MIQPEEIRAAVRNLRDSLELTQTQFAQELGMSLPTIQRWEGVVPPAGEALVALAQLAERYGKGDLHNLFLATFAKEAGLDRGNASLVASNTDRKDVDGILIIPFHGREQYRKAFEFLEEWARSFESRSPRAVERTLKGGRR